MNDPMMSRLVNRRRLVSHGSAAAVALAAESRLAAFIPNCGGAGCHAPGQLRGSSTPYETGPGKDFEEVVGGIHE